MATSREVRMEIVEEAEKFTEECLQVVDDKLPMRSVSVAPAPCL